MAITPLLKAAVEGNLAKVQDCLAQGDDIDATEDHETALTWAAYYGHTEVVRCLIDNGANLAAMDAQGRNSRQLAKYGGHPDTEALLASAQQQPKRPARASEDWLPMGPASVSLVGIYPAPMRKLTQIFNFETRERVMIVENLATKTETVLPPTNFDDLPPAVIEKALDACESLGGKPDRDAALQGIGRLEKQRKPRPPDALSG
jgi:hypothetical protein